MPALFSKLRKQLLDYRKADFKKRAHLINTAKAAIQSIQGVEKEDVQKAYETLTLSAVLIQYADTLNMMESKKFFKIPEVFKGLEFEFGPGAPKEPGTVTEYFEVSNTPYTQMRLLKPITAIPKNMWKALREKQKELLEKEKITDQYLLDELDIDHPPSDALYPLRVQFQPRLRHREFDCIGPNKNGTFYFYNNPTENCLLLPSGSDNPTFCSSNFRRTEKTSFIHNYLDEHLALHHPNLYNSAAKAYNEINQEEFNSSLMAVIKRFESLVGETIFQNLTYRCKEKKDNAVILSSLISYLNNIGPINTAWTHTKKLKACLQVETFRLTNIYESAIKYLKKSPVKSIEQFGDTKQGGGYQFSDVIFLPKSLTHWLKDKHKLNPENSSKAENIKQRQILDLLKNKEQINFSTLLTVLQSTKKVKEQTPLNRLAEIFEEVKKILLAKADRVIQNENESHQALLSTYQYQITRLKNYLQSNIQNDKKYNSLIKHINQLIHDLEASTDKIPLETQAVIAEGTLQLVYNQMTPDQYNELAKNFMQGEKRPALIKLGVAMLAIALAVTALAAFGVLPVIAAGVGAGSVFLISCGLFAKARESGLRKDMSNLTKDTAKLLPTPTA